MMAERMWGAGMATGAVLGLVSGCILSGGIVCAAMAGESPQIVSLHGEKGRPRVVEIGGTVYRLVSESRYSELRGYEWAAKHGR